MSEKAEGLSGLLADRRLFLRGTAVAAVVAPLAAEGETLAKATNHRTAARYQETEHVKRFYALNRR